MNALAEYAFGILHDSAGVNLVSNVNASDTPIAPLGLAIGGINANYTPFASLRLW